jgi:hypothetical protein
MSNGLAMSADHAVPRSTVLKNSGSIAAFAKVAQANASTSVATPTQQVELWDLTPPLTTQIVKNVITTRSVPEEKR